MTSGILEIEFHRKITFEIIRRTAITKNVNYFIHQIVEFHHSFPDFLDFENAYFLFVNSR